MWRIIIGTHTYNVKISRTDTGYIAEFDKKNIPPMRLKKASREIVRNHILNHKKNTL
jgi:hypothetical protein